MPTISNAALNRALLARQMLLERETLHAKAAVARLAGLQAQQARPPFVGLWTRLKDFQRQDLCGELVSHRVLRLSAMRATLHLMTKEDAALFGGALQPALAGAMESILKTRKATVHLEAVLSAARAEFQKGPRTFEEIRTCLRAHFPAEDERAMGYAVRMSLPLAAQPDDSVWAFGGDARFRLISPPREESRTDELVLRYLSAFGPASVADAQTWSGLKGLKPVFAGLRDQLMVLRDEQNRELFDLPSSPRPPAGTPAPVRLLPAFDNAILAHADRSRIIATEYRARVATKNLLILPTVLVEGFVAGVWHYQDTARKATLTLTPFHPWSARQQKQIKQEAEMAARFLARDGAQVEVAIAQ